MPEGTPRPFERQIHPGSGRRKAPKTPKGRQLDVEALAEVQALLGDKPRRPDLLIEHLHLIQDAAGGVGARLPLTDVAERLYAAAQAAGHGDEDLAVVVTELAREVR